MMVMWFTLLVLHRGYTMTPVVSVQLSDPVTLTCALHKTAVARREVYLYRHRAGEILKLIVSLWPTQNAEFSGEVNKSRLKIDKDENFVNLTILKTTVEDEGMYHCEIMEWGAKPEWNGTYLLVKGNSEKTLNYSVVQSSSVSGPVRPGDSVSLQCSVLSDANKTCPGGPSVYWIRTGSDKSGLGIIYTDVNDECEQRSDSVKSCVYRFSKNVSSSDAGTYHCAVASCAHILFGDGTKLNIDSTFISVVILTVCLIFSVFGNIIFICYQTRPVCLRLKGRESSSAQQKLDNSSHRLCYNDEDKHELNYAALSFAGGKPQSGRKKMLNNEQSVYAAVKT